LTLPVLAIMLLGVSVTGDAERFNASVPGAGGAVALWEGQDTLRTSRAGGVVIRRRNISRPIVILRGQTPPPAESEVTPSDLQQLEDRIVARMGLMLARLWQPDVVTDDARVVVFQYPDGRVAIADPPGGIPEGIVPDTLVIPMVDSPTLPGLATPPLPDTEVRRLPRAEPLLPELPPVDPEPGRALSETGLFRAFSIQFAFDSEALLPSSDATLEAIAAFLQADETVRIEVIGHTDDRGNARYNLELSRRRAQSVADHLVARFGISADRLKVSGMGESAPLLPNTSETNRVLNRRVEFRIVE
jgi:outer membrane protein OmpA-like peptidoglycan-associated protein